MQQAQGYQQEDCLRTKINHIGKTIAKKLRERNRVRSELRKAEDDYSVSQLEALRATLRRCRDLEEPHAPHAKDTNENADGDSLHEASVQSREQELNHAQEEAARQAAQIMARRKAKQEAKRNKRQSKRQSTRQSKRQSRPRFKWYVEGSLGLAH